MTISWAAFVASLSSLVGSKIIEVDFYRAMRGAHVAAVQLENDNMASLVGVLKYVHTEVIVEHATSPQDRLTRKNSIDVIAGAKFSVQNPATLLSPSSLIMQHVDFGPFVTYDNGVATNSVQLQYIKRHGGFVGVQEQRDVRFPYNNPYYWFSVSGFCPNLPWADKGTRLSPNPVCLRHDDGNWVEGGLCMNTSDPQLQPTGHPNCTYTYQNQKVVLLDELVGIEKEDCGGRKCRNWADFRLNCSDAKYRVAFDLQTGYVTPYPYCVEYDINPACAADCEAPACLALPEEQREVGIPFWRGRCNARRNAWRAEALGAAFGLVGAAGRHELALLPAPAAAQRCAYAGGMCQPSPAAGGTYCSRAWAGVCHPCWIPGTETEYPLADQPLCPYNILKIADYSGDIQVSPRCNSTRPRDKCCLYRSPPTCDPHLTSGALPLDEDGYALAAAEQNTTVMAAFLTRVAAERLGCVVMDPAGLERVAYWEWGMTAKSRTLEAVELAMAPYLVCPTQTGAVTLTSTQARTTTTASDDTSTSSIAKSPNDLGVFSYAWSAVLLLTRACF